MLHTAAERVFFFLKGKSYKAAEIGTCLF